MAKRAAHSERQKVCTWNGQVFDAHLLERVACDTTDLSTVQCSAVQGTERRGQGSILVVPETPVCGESTIPSRAPLLAIPGRRRGLHALTRVGLRGAEDYALLSNLSISNAVSRCVLDGSSRCRLWVLIGPIIGLLIEPPPS